MNAAIIRTRHAQALANFKRSINCFIQESAALKRLSTAANKAVIKRRRPAAWELTR